MGNHGKSCEKTGWPLGADLFDLSPQVALTLTIFQHFLDCCRAWLQIKTVSCSCCRWRRSYRTRPSTTSVNSRSDRFRNTCPTKWWTHNPLPCPPIYPWEVEVVEVVEVVEAWGVAGWGAWVEVGVLFCFLFYFCLFQGSDVDWFSWFWGIQTDFWLIFRNICQKSWILPHEKIFDHIFPVLRHHGSRLRKF